MLNPPSPSRQVGDARKMLWHDAHGNWVAGESVHLGHAAGVLAAADRAMRPENITVAWALLQYEPKPAGRCAYAATQHVPL